MRSVDNHILRTRLSSVESMVGKTVRSAHNNFMEPIFITFTDGTWIALNGKKDWDGDVELYVEDDVNFNHVRPLLLSPGECAAIEAEEAAERARVQKENDLARLKALRRELAQLERDLAGS